MTITYVYDKLYRLIEANYSDGRYFHYTYDPVGNRLSEEKCLTPTGCVTPITNTYDYDDANRLIEVNEQAYDWDDNGNLLDDGTHTYDAANRLTGVTDGVTPSTYTYNGLGDRLSQTVDSVTTDYILDLNAGLTQVLDNGTNTYLYGNGRIGELQPSGFAFHLGDALGSVRQLSDVSGDVTLAKSYEPFGSILTSTGSGSSAFAFTGEQWDSQTGLIYLRARYYAPYLKQWLQLDPITPNWQSPNTLNSYSYVLNNPINFTDSSGMCAEQDSTCWATAERIVAEFPNIRINMGVNNDPLTKFIKEDVLKGICEGQWFSKHWETEDLEHVHNALKLVLYAFDNDGHAFEEAFGTITLSRQWTTIRPFLAQVNQTVLPQYIVVFDSGSDDPNLSEAIVHEMGHILDFREYNRGYAYVTKAKQWSSGLLDNTQGTCKVMTPTSKCLGGYEHVGITTEYGVTDLAEDFAESFRLWVISKNNLVSNYVGSVDQTRLNYIQQVADHYKIQ